MSVFIPVVCALLCSAFWAGTSVSGKILSGSTPALILAFLRYAIAVVCLLPLTRQADYRKLKVGHLGTLLLLGFSLVLLVNGLFFTALQFTSATTATLILSTNPVLTLVISSIIFGRMPTRYQLGAFMLSLLGVVMVITKGTFGYAVFSGSIGEALVLGAVLSQIAYTMTLKRIVGTFSPIFLTFATGIAGLLFFLPFIFNQAVLDGIAALRFFDWALLGYIGIFGTAIAIICYSTALQKMGPAKTSLIVFSTQPIFVFILSFLLLGDSISCWQAGGGLLVLLALLIALTAE